MKNDLNKVVEEFEKRIQDSEETLYERLNAENENLNEKIHRVQFGIIDVNVNWPVKEILERSGKKNPKFLVHISGMNLVSVMNNLSEITRRHG